MGRMADSHKAIRFVSRIKEKYNPIDMHSITQNRNAVDGGGLRAEEHRRASVCVV